MADVDPIPYDASLTPNDAGFDTVLCRVCLASGMSFPTGERSLLLAHTYHAVLGLSRIIVNKRLGVPVV